MKTAKLIQLIIIHVLISSFRTEYLSNINNIFNIEYTENTSQALVNQNSFLTGSIFFISNNNILFSLISSDSKLKIVSFNDLTIIDSYTTENPIIQHDSGLKIYMGFIPISEDEVIIFDHKVFEPNLILINCTFKKIDINGAFQNSSNSIYSDKAVSIKQEADASSFYHSQLLDATYVNRGQINYLMVLALDRRKKISNNFM